MAKSINDIIRQRNRIYNALFYCERRWVTDDIHPHGYYKYVQNNPGPVWVKRWNRVWELAEAWCNRIGQSDEWKQEFARVCKEPLFILSETHPVLYEAEQKRLAYSAADRVKVDFYNK